jgi:hypothetical protein
VSDTFYGMSPVSVGAFDLSNEWHEFMHYLDLPIRIPRSDSGLRTTSLNPFTLPKRLEFVRDIAMLAISDAQRIAPHLTDPYVYVTLHRGMATPGNALNRPGWHTDDFGGRDLNYVWNDVFPTKFLLADQALEITGEDRQSMIDMADWAHVAEHGAHHARSLADTVDLRSKGIAYDAMGWPKQIPGLRVEHAPINELLRLNPYVIHCVPDVPHPGGMRSFLKVTISDHRHDLVGNSHNYELDYAWSMRPRQSSRNLTTAEDQRKTTTKKKKSVA